MGTRGLSRRGLLRACGGAYLVWVASQANTAAAQGSGVVIELTKSASGVWQLPATVNGVALTQGERVAMGAVVNRAAAVGGGALVRSTVTGLATSVMARPLAVGGLVALVGDALYYTMTGRRFLDAAKVLSWVMDALGIARLGIEAAKGTSPATIPEYGTGLYPQPTAQNPCRTYSVIRQFSEGYGNVPTPAGYDPWHQVNTQTGIIRWWLKINDDPCPGRAREDLPAIPVTQVHEVVDEEQAGKDASKELVDALARAITTLLPSTVRQPLEPLPVPATDPPGVTVGDFFKPRPALFPPGTVVTVEFKDPGGQTLPDPTPTTEPGTGTGTGTGPVKIDTTGEPDTQPGAPDEPPTAVEWLNPLRDPLSVINPQQGPIGQSCPPLATIDTFENWGGEALTLDWCPAFEHPGISAVVNVANTIGPPITALMIVLDA